MRYRHADSDFVRVARQQDFLRNLREQVSPATARPDRTRRQGRRPRDPPTFSASASELLELAKLIAFSQGKPLRQVKFQTSDVNAQFKGGSYVTSTPTLEQTTLEDFLHGARKRSRPHRLPRPRRAPRSHAPRTSSRAGLAARRSASYPTTGESEAVTAALKVPFRVLYPALQTGPADSRRCAPTRCETTSRHSSTTPTWSSGGRTRIGGYYDFQGTDWLNPPLFANARTQSRSAGAPTSSSTTARTST